MWLTMVTVHQHDFGTLDKELDNLLKAVHHAGQEARAAQNSLKLLILLWNYVEFRGHWLLWQSPLAAALALSRQHGGRDDEATVLVQLGELARILGRAGTALEHFRAAQALLEDLGDARGAARVLSFVSQVHLTLGAAAAAEACCQEAAATAAALGDRKGLALAHNNWGIVCLERRDFDAGLGHLTAADRLFQQAGKLRGQAKAATNLASLYQDLGRIDDALQAYAQAIDLYDLIGDELNAARTQVNLAVLWYEQGRTPDALAATAGLEATFARLGDKPWLARVVNNTGVFLQALGRLDEAVAAFDRAAGLYLEAHDRRYACSARLNCVDALLDHGQPAAAAAAMAQVDALLREMATVPAWLREEVEEQAVRLRTADPRDRADQSRA